MRIDGTQKVWFIMPRSAVEKEKAAEFFFRSFGGLRNYSA
jgi:hypothetical protein